LPQESTRVAKRKTVFVIFVPLCGHSVRAEQSRLEQAQRRSGNHESTLFLFAGTALRLFQPTEWTSTNVDHDE
jgi:hypothetical protein